MADPLLSTLCSVCHSSSHKYRCPRCSTLTCSLRCCSLHKLRAPCSGVRDPAAYLARADLATPRGIDHDYNYLTSLERALDRADRDLDDRGLLVTSSAADQEHALGVSPARPAKGEAPLHAALQRTGVIIQRAPVGMTRAKQNTTQWRKKQRRLVWSVEWILPDGTRSIREVPEDQELAEAYSSLFARPPPTGTRKKRRKIRANEDAGVAAERQRQEVEPPSPPPSLPASASDLPSPVAYMPNMHQSSSSHRWAPSTETSFHLHSPCLPTRHKVLIPLESNATLASSLRNRLVLEFPTVYVFTRHRSNEVRLSKTPSLPEMAMLEEQWRAPTQGGEKNEELPEGFVTEAQYYRSHTANSTINATSSACISIQTDGEMHRETGKEGERRRRCEGGEESSIEEVR